jgi:hypothetical protein
VTGPIRFRLRRVLVAAAVPLALLAVVLNGGGITVPPSGAKQSSTTTTTLPPTELPVVNTLPFPAPTGSCGLRLSDPQHVIRAVGRCRVLEIGDSLGVDLAEGLQHRLPATTGIYYASGAKVSSGLTNQWFYNWPKQLDRLENKFHPQLVIIFIGTNDQRSIRVHGRFVAFGSPAWQAGFRGLIHQLALVGTSHGSYVLWVGLPIMQNHPFANGARLINKLATQIATTTPGVVFLPTWTVLENDSGNYQSWAFVNRVVEPLRRRDGIHLTDAGHDVLATYVVREMALIYHVNLKPKAPVIVTGW